MKKILLGLMIVMFNLPLAAQFSKASLQATGLTCAMCSNAINKALQAVPFVESVRSDIKNSAFSIVFKEGATVEIDGLKNAVEDAGFSVGSLKLTGQFSGLKLVPDQHVKIGTLSFHFLNSQELTLDGEATLTVVDRNFLPAKQFKKISSLTKMACLQTGKASSCCTKEGVAPEARVYHVTI